MSGSDAEDVLEMFSYRVRVVIARDNLCLLCTPVNTVSVTPPHPGAFLTLHSAMISSPWHREFSAPDHHEHHLLPPHIPPPHSEPRVSEQSWASDQWAGAGGQWWPVHAPGPGGHCGGLHEDKRVQGKELSHISISTQIESPWDFSYYQLPISPAFSSQSLMLFVINVL